MKKKSIVLLVVAISMYCFCTTGCEQLLSQAKGQVSNHQFQNDTRIVNDDWDYGVTVSFAVKNIGKKGVITIAPKLSCSEGEWTREQSIRFDEGETKTFTYFFQEPTINATNIYGSVNVYP